MSAECNLFQSPAYFDHVMSEKSPVLNLNHRKIRKIRSNIVTIDHSRPKQQQDRGVYDSMKLVEFESYKSKKKIENNLLFLPNVTKVEKVGT